MTPKEKLILGISWGCVALVGIYMIWVFAKYGIDPHHNFGFPIF